LFDFCINERVIHLDEQIRHSLFVGPLSSLVTTLSAKGVLEARGDLFSGTQPVVWPVVSFVRQQKKCGQKCETQRRKQWGSKNSYRHICRAGRPLWGSQEKYSQSNFSASAYRKKSKALSLVGATIQRFRYICGRKFKDVG
jgi:hypothetical protein